MKTAYFNTQMKTLTLFVSRNTTETVNCPNLAIAKHKVKQTGIDQKNNIEMKAQPIYSTAKSHAAQRKQRRRIGQMPAYLKNELNAMSTTERARMRIAVGMAMVTLLNQ